MNLENRWVHDFGKFKMVLDKTDVDISQQIKVHGWYEDEKFESEIFSKHLRSGMSVLDLGANIGFYTMLARSIVGPQGRVVAFEPFPDNAELIRESKKENCFDNIIVIEAAVSDTKKRTLLHLSPDACSEHSLLNLNFHDNVNSQILKDIQVNTLTVDGFFEEFFNDYRVDFIKMDIEGYESNALIGMKRVLEENDNISIMTEFWPNGFSIGGNSPTEFLETLMSLGFTIFHIDNQQKEVYPVGINKMMEIVDFQNNHLPENNKVMQRWGWYTNLLCKK